MVFIPVNPALSDVPVISISYSARSLEISLPSTLSPIDFPIKFSFSVSTLNVFPLRDTFILNMFIGEDLGLKSWWLIIK